MKLATIGAVVLILTCIPAFGSAGDGPALTVKSDPAIELLSVIFRLAGNREYNQGQLTAYNIAVNKHFGKYKNHDAVKLAAKLRQTKGISFDAVMSMAVHIRNPFHPQARIPLEPRPDSLEKRWSVKDARAFIEAARRFVNETKFKAFIETHQPLYKETVKRLKAVIDQHSRLEWFDEFFGKRPGARFVLIPGMLNGGASYGVKFKGKNNREIIYSVLGVWKTDNIGLPAFDAAMVETIVHEFSHSYVNRLVEKYKKQLENAGKKIYPHVETIMKQNAYGKWETMIMESMVRAVTIRYLLDREGPDRAEKNIAHDRRKGFYWIRELAGLLDQYEKNRDKYPGLDDFMPKVTAFFNNYSGKIKQKMAGLDAEKQKKMKYLREKGPKIIKMTPANGSDNVDPGLKMIIITFDRPMRDKSWSVMRSGMTFPPLAGDVYYGSAKKIFYMPVKLQPKTVYGFGLNAENYYGFSSADGVPLLPLNVTFKTGAAR